MLIQHRHMASLFYAPFPDLLWKFPPYSNTVYLTFDDGPYPAVTGPLLALLNEMEVPATFFLSGENIFRYRREISELDYSPHVIGSHLFHHLPLFGLSEARMIRELNCSDEIILKYFGRLAQAFRPPYGIFNRKLFPILQSTAKQMVLWSVMAYDFKWPAERVLQHLCRTTRSGDIVVFHDSQLAEGVLMKVIPEFIRHCRNHRWQFGVVI